MFPVLQKSSLCLCHFKKEVCAASLKAHLQPALSVQNVKSHQDRAIEKREAENLEKNHRRGELKEPQLQYFPGSLIHSFLPLQAPNRLMPNLAVVVHHLLLNFFPFIAPRIGPTYWVLEVLI